MALPSASAARLRRRSLGAFEALEPRLALSIGHPIISEVAATGSPMLADEDSEHSDWIEIYNPEPTPIDISGWSLTDRANLTGRWTIPTGTVLEGGEFLIVFASGKNRAVLGEPLHASFALDQNGETVTLLDATGATRHAIAFGNQPENVSYGVAFTAGEADLNIERYFSTPTPGAANGVGVVGFVAEPTLSQSHGFYTSAFSLAISTTTAGASIYYTTDGSVPSPDNPQALLYVDGARPTIARTTVVRAAANKDSFAASMVATQSYLFIADVLSQSPDGAAPVGWPAAGFGPNDQVLNYGMDPAIVNDPVWGPQLTAALTAIPSFSLVTDLDNLFDPTSGIYVNAEAHGEDWERPTSVELIDPSGTLGFQADAGLRIRGGFSRTQGNPKHAFRLFFRQEYGETKLAYPLFGDDGASEFDAFDLRTDQNDSWAYQRSREMTMMHDIFSRETQHAMGQPYTRSNYYHLYINGVYWGLYQTQERAEASYGESYFGGHKDDYDVVKSTGSPAYETEATDGNLDAWQAMWQLARSVRTDPDAYYRLQGLNPDGTRNPSYPVLLDVDNLIDYLTILFYTGDEDASLSQPFGNSRSNNWYAMRNRVGSEGFRFFVHDAEQTLFSNHNVSDLSADRTGPFLHPNQDFVEYSNPHWIHQDLMASAEYRLRFADRVAKHLAPGGALSQSAIQARWSSLANIVALPIIAESARWGDAQQEPPFTKTDWNYAVDNVAQRFFPAREKIFLDQLRNDERENPVVPGQLIPGALYPSVAAPQFSLPPGRVPFGQSAGILAPNVETNLDATLVATSTPKRAFVPTSDALGVSWTMPGFNDSLWQSGTSGIGYERNTSSVDSVQSLIGTNVSSMYAQRTSVFTRMTFTIGANDHFDRLLLRMRYDDGFIAYIDGVEVVRSGNTPRGNPIGDTAGGRLDKLARQVEEHDISAFLATLAPGSHVLAIHGYNDFTFSSRMLILPELVGRRVTTSPSTSAIYYTTDGSDPRLAGGAISPSARRYDGTFPLTLSGTVKARALSAGTWSALSTATYSVASPIRISEIMYHPAPQTADEITRTADGATIYDADEFEFIELVNTGDLPAPITGLRFSDGVRIVLSEDPLAPGEHAVVARNADAFTSRYGHSARIVGEYGVLPEDDRLSNSGEQIALADADGYIIGSFTYDDASPWPTSADGGGDSLVIVDESADPAAWSHSETWRASRELNGSPGERDAMLGDFNADDRVGLADLILLRNHLGTTSGATRATGDLTGDGAVTLADVAAWAHHFGNQSTTAVTSPSPAPSAPTASGIIVQVAARRTLARRAVDHVLSVEASRTSSRRNSIGVANTSPLAARRRVAAWNAAESAKPVANQERRVV